jgi:hypothetical protein
MDGDLNKIRKSKIIHLKIETEVCDNMCRVGNQRRWDCMSKQNQAMERWHVQGRGVKTGSKLLNFRQVAFPYTNKGSDRRLIIAGEGRLP